jgi:hypothetical protein
MKSINATKKPVAVIITKGREAQSSLRDFFDFQQQTRLIMNIIVETKIESYASK